MGRKGPRGSLPDVDPKGVRTIVTPRGVLVDMTPMRTAIAALRRSEELNRTVVSALQEGVIVLDEQGRVLSANDSAVTMLEDAPGLATGGTLPADLHALCGDGEEHDHEILRRGERRLAVTVRPLRRSREDVAWGHVVSLSDVTEHHRQERRLQRERDRAQRLLDLAGTVIVLLDSAGRIELLNRAGYALLGHPEGSLVGTDWFDEFVPEPVRDETRGVHAELMTGEAAPSAEVYENEVVTAKGEHRLVSWHNTVLCDEEGGIVGTLSAGLDVTERRDAERQVAHLAYHDRLTGLPNRTMLEAELGRALARGRRNGTAVALLYLDLDDFKLVNDSLGHSAGDRVLQEAAQRLADATRAGDVLARQGGDEFLLLLTDLDEGAETVAAAAGRRVAAALEAPFAINGSSFQVGASVGIALYPRDAADAGGLLKAADTAMYAAKRDERSGYAFFAREGDDARERLALSSRLRGAIEADELALHFQPILDLRTGRMASAEALLRWGAVSPAVFIPLAEDMGLIDALGDWVFDALCAQSATWSGQGLRIPLSFNISPRQLRRPGLAERIELRMREHGVDPELICAEITESTAMADAARTEDELRALHATGVRIAIDDFGSGHSSLSRLRELPVDILKIDRSFLRDVPEDSSSSAIVDAIAALSAALGVVTVVEGIETPEQQQFVTELGCEYGQGFLFARPGPADGLPELQRTLAVR